MTQLRPDLKAIAGMVPKGARMLDVGCGTGDLLAYLRDEKSVDGRGIELDNQRVNAALAKGLSVIQGDADQDLAGYPANAFDIAILSQTIQAMHRPRDVLADLMRVAGATIVSFPNFGYWRIRAALAIQGRMPVTRNLPNHWYDTPNIHLCTVIDFSTLCEELSAKVEDAIAITPGGAARHFHPGSRVANLTAETAIFKISK